MGRLYGAAGAVGIEVVLIPCLLLSVISIWLSWRFSRKKAKRKRLTLLTLVFSLSILLSAWTIAILGVSMSHICAITAGALEWLGLVAFAAIWTLYAFVRWVAVPSSDWARKQFKEKQATDEHKE